MPKNNTSLIAKTIPSTQVLLWKYYLPVKETRVSKKNGAGKVQNESGKHLNISDRKKGIKNYESHIKMIQDSTWRGSHWPKMNCLNLNKYSDNSV